MQNYIEIYKNDKTPDVFDSIEKYYVGLVKYFKNTSPYSEQVAYSFYLMSQIEKEGVLSNLKASFEFIEAVANAKIKPSSEFNKYYHFFIQNHQSFGFKNNEMPFDEVALKCSNAIVAIQNMGMEREIKR